MKEADIRNQTTLSRYLELVAKDAEELFSPEDFLDSACATCGISSSNVVIQKGAFRYVECPECSSFFVSPRPTPSALEQFYVNSPSTSYWVNDFFKPVAKQRRERMFRPRAEKIATEFSTLSKGVIGDVGAGFGIFLDELRQFWPDSRLIAIEPSTEMAEICREQRFEVVPSTLERCVVDNNARPIGEQLRFDLLTAFELFEHLHDPMKFLEAIFQLLRPGGVFVLTTLSGLGFDIQMLWERSKAVFPPHHLNFYNPWSLKKLLSNIGFTDVEITTPGQLDWDIVEGAMQRGEFPGSRFLKSMAKLADESQKQAFQTWLQQTNLSSHMRAVARRPLR